MGDILDLAALGQELEAASSHFGAWSDGRVRAAEARLAAHESALDQHGATTRKLTQQRAGLEAQAHATDTALAAAEKEVMELKHALDACSLRENELPAQIDAIQGEVAVQAKEVESKEGELSAAEAARNRQLGSLRAAVHCYSHNLGLRFERRAEPTGSTLAFAFTQIDPARPEHEFVFSIYLSPSGQYSVTQCDPPVEGLDELAASLNANSDFSAFVRAMRSRFKALATV